MITDLHSGNTIRTNTGKFIDVFNPNPELICIEDIAHSLSFQCRFGGHTNDFYSVAQHSYHVSKRVLKVNALSGLLHDAAEAYMLDMPSPIKKQLPQYKEAEENLLKVIFERFGLKYPYPTEIKEVDMYMLGLEHNLLVAGINTGHLIPMSQPVAKKFFLQRFYELTK